MPLDHRCSRGLQFWRAFVLMIAMSVCREIPPPAGMPEFRNGSHGFLKKPFIAKIYLFFFHREGYSRCVTPVHRIVAQYPCYYWTTAPYCGKKGNGTEQHVSPQAMPGILLIILGIVLGSDRFIGYAFLGAGVIIAIFNAVKNRQKK